jgi:hypothetical protein
MTQAERRAIETDAAATLEQLYQHERRLLPDADDPECLSELTWIWGRIRLAEAELPRIPPHRVRRPSRFS